MLQVCCKYHPSTNENLALISRNVHLWSNPGGALNAPLSPSEDWVHVAFVGDSTGRTIFINGEAVATGAAATPLNASDFFFNMCLQLFVTSKHMLLFHGCFGNIL